MFTVRRAVIEKVYKEMAATYDKTISTQEYDSQRDLDLAEWEEQLKMTQYTFSSLQSSADSDSETG